MKKVTLYVPLQTGRQKACVHGLEGTLGLEYGGYTRYLHVGEWVDGGDWNQEAGASYVVLCDDPTAAVEALRQFGRLAYEKAIAYDIAEVEARIEAVRKETA